MSSVYHTEPPTLGKVIFHTSYGPIDVELWSKEAPRACRNFVQLALEGYYDRTVFHRVIPGFMVQGGDPTGTGEGGDSVWGKAFRDETNARIRFNHRGQLAMANENKPDTNRSQFFFSLDECRWLDGKHTIFGTVAGNTVFNLLRMGEAELENDRPVEDIVLKTVEVLANPFDDVVPRPVSSSEPEVAEKKVPQRKATKDLKLLSFGGEEEPLPEEAPAAKQKPRPVPLPGFSPYDSDDSDDSEAAPPKKRVVDRARDAGDFSAKMAARLKERQARAKRREAKTEDDVGEKLAAIKEESRKARAALKVAPATAKKL
ncbi:hypothetical protein CTAYLR_004543 [Chrysophaeum taylorii]|uniref:PPIase cyclophilin-type domain-containing protein n=1 Tax=Chrysophaeum taylorii TaxID=2483200 RepID=A0AAD7UMW7_9STRA|nr:hypothetical protein CTAYLR_004543 [Chrysophaeum taylorii]